MLNGPILAIESSCDETAAAILSAEGKVLANVVHSQVATHAEFGGVVPEIASREHLAKISSVCDRAFREADLSPNDLTHVAATYGPGLIGALLVGLSYAKGLAQALDLTFIGVHHIEGHLWAHSVVEGAPEPPFIGLVASGGHSALYRYEGVGRAKLLGETLDDAAGEAFDKSAKLLGLGYPGGAVIDRLAQKGDDTRFDFPVALRSKDTLDYSFSGLKTSVRLTVKKICDEKGVVDGQDLFDVCASLRKAVADALLRKLWLACKKEKMKRVVLGGGVTANSLLRERAVAEGKKRGIDVFVAPRKYCTDNAVMIAACARAMALKGRTQDLTLRANAGVELSDALNLV